MELSIRQQALVLHAQKIHNAEIARRLGVTRAAVGKWVKQDKEAPKPVTESQVIARVQAARTESAKVIPIRPALPPANDSDPATSLEERAVAVLQASLEEGDAATARWVLERIRAEVYGSAADKKVMAELRKAAGEAQSARVVVTIGGARPRKQAAG
jgi:hypothetical protein